MGVRDMLFGAVIGASLVLLALVPLLSTGVTDVLPTPPAVANELLCPSIRDSAQTNRTAGGTDNSTLFSIGSSVPNDEAPSKRWADYLSQPRPPSVAKTGPCTAAATPPRKLSPKGTVGTKQKQDALADNRSSAAAMALYTELPGIDYNMNFGDLGSPFEALPDGPTGSQICVEHCEATPHCGAVVVRGGSCWMKRAPAMLETGVSAATSSFVRKDLALQYVRQRDFTQRIAFGMLAAPKYLFTRASVALSTWLCGFSVLLLLEDEAGADDKFRLMLGSLPAACQAGKAAKFRAPAEPNPRGGPGAWKDLPMSRLLLAAFPGRDWYGIVDDDTYVLTHNLNLELSTFYSAPPSRAAPICVGAEFVVSGNRKLRFPQGGAGIFLSQRAAAAIASQEAACLAQCQQRTGDIRLGCCLALLGIPTRSTDTMWSRSPFMALGADRRAESAAFPTSFHQMRRAAWVRDLHAWAGALVADVHRTCRPGAALAGMHMCRLLALQDALCSSHSAGGRDGAVLSVPVTWDALSHHLQVEQTHNEELFR